MIFGMKSIRFYKIECSKNNESDYFKDFQCVINKLGRNNYALTVLADLVIPINFMNISVDAFYRQSNISVYNITFEFCSSFTKLPTFISVVTEIVNRFNNNLIHACPYKPKSKIGVENFPVGVFVPFYAFINVSRGDYIVTLNCLDNNNKLVFKIGAYLTYSQNRAPKSG